MADEPLKRGRKAIEVNPTELQTQISQLEAAQADGGKFPNRSALWVALEATEWAKSRNPRPLTAQVAMLIAKANNLTVATPVGKRGREKGQAPVNAGKRKPKQLNTVWLDAMKKEMPEYTKLAEKAAKGSLKAVIKLNCLNCCCLQKKEVSLCVITGCPLWGVRPYKHKESLTEAGRKKISLGMYDDPEPTEENQNADSTGTNV